MGSEMLDGLLMDEWRNQSLLRSRERAPEPEVHALNTPATPAYLALAFDGRGATEPFFVGHRLAALRQPTAAGEAALRPALAGESIPAGPGQPLAGAIG